MHRTTSFKLFRSCIDLILSNFLKCLNLIEMKYLFAFLFCLFNADDILAQPLKKFLTVKTLAAGLYMEQKNGMSKKAGWFVKVGLIKNTDTFRPISLTIILYYT